MNSHENGVRAEVQIRTIKKFWTDGDDWDKVGNDVAVMALEKPFTIVYGLVEPAKRVKDLETKFGKINAFGSGGFIKEQRQCYSVSWKQAYDDPFYYKFSVVEVKTVKIDKCQKKMWGSADAIWDNIICTKSVASDALYHGADFGSPLICLFLVPKPNPPQYGSKRYWVPIVSGIAMNQEISDPVLYTKIAPFNDFARETALEWIVTQNQGDHRSSHERIRYKYGLVLLLYLLLIICK